MSPVTDLAGEGTSLIERADRDPMPAAVLVQALGGAYLDGRDPKQTPLASPLYADLHGLPSMIVTVGTEEGLHDDSIRSVEKVRAAGGDITLETGVGLYHIYPIFDFLPEGQQAVERIGTFLKDHFSADGN